MPTAAFTYVQRGLEVTLDPHTSTPDVDETITSYSWDYADPDPNTGTEYVDDGDIAHKVYTAAGSIDVTLTVTDSGSGTDSVTHTIVVVDLTNAQAAIEGDWYVSPDPDPAPGPYPTTTTTLQFNGVLRRPSDGASYLRIDPDGSCGEMTLSISDGHEIQNLYFDTLQPGGGPALDPQIVNLESVATSAPPFLFPAAAIGGTQSYILITDLYPGLAHFVIEVGHLTTPGDTGTFVADASFARDLAITDAAGTITVAFDGTAATVGDPWSATGTVEATVTGTTTLKFIQDDIALGDATAIHVVDDAAVEYDTTIGFSPDGAYIDLPDTVTFPIAYTISGTTTDPVDSVTLTAEIIDQYGAPFATATDTFHVNGDGPPGSGLELYLLDGDTPAWVDLIDGDLGVRDTFTCSRTATLQGPYLHQQAGRLAFTLDNGATAETVAGQWSPENTGSPWRDPTTDQTLLRQGLPARVSITPPGSDPVDVWFGRVTDWPPDYLSDLYSTVDVVCIDPVDRLQAANLPELQDPVGANETAPDRIARILDRIDYPSYSLGDSAWTRMQATTLSRAAWDEMLLTADSDGGYVYLDPTGQVRYLARDFHVGLDPAATFSLLGPTDDGYDVDDIVFTDQSSTNDTSQQFNVIKLATTGGTEQAATADDLDTTDFYGVRTYDRSDLVTANNRQTMDLALWTVGLTRTADFRFSKVQVDLYDQTPLAAWTAVLALDLFSKVRVKLKTPDGRTISVDHLVSGITWTINPRQSIWRCTLDLAAAPPDYPLMEFDGTGDDAELTMEGLVAPWV